MATTTQIMAQVAHAPRLQKAVEQTLVELGLNPAVNSPRINTRCVLEGEGGKGVDFGGARLQPCVGGGVKRLPTPFTCPSSAALPHLQLIDAWRALTTSTSIAPS